MINAVAGYIAFLSSARIGITIVAFARSARAAVSSGARCCEPIIWFTASTTFANPAVTIARSLSDTFTDVAPGGVVASSQPTALRHLISRIIEIFFDSGGLIR
jgi:hypothetical protein